MPAPPPLLDLYNENTDTSVFKVNSQGRVTSPFTYANTTANAANVYISSNGTIYRSTSSARYKKHIKDYEHGLEKLDSLRPVTYEAKDDENGRTYAGFIAEEVDKAGLREFVVYNDAGEPDAVQYGHMTALLAKALQELAAKNAALEERVAALEAQATAGPAAAALQSDTGLRPANIAALLLAAIALVVAMMARRR